MDGIDRGSGLPPYQEVAQVLREAIERGQLHGRLPSEVALAAQLRVSKTTLRKALKILRGEGLVATAAGWGSRVVPPGERGGTAAGL